MSILNELEELAGRIGADAERFTREGKQELAQHVKEHPQPLFALLRTVKPVLLVHDIALVTRYADVVEVLTNDDVFSVEPYMAKMKALAGEFILGLDDSVEYERAVSILRLAAPRSDLAGLAAFVEETAASLVADGVRAGRVDVADVARRVPARLVGRWFGTPGPDEDSLIAWTLALFEEIFVNIQNDRTVHDAAQSAAVQLRAYLVDTIATRKAQPSGEDDVLGRLLAMQSNAATSFTDDEIVTNIFGLVVGFVPTVLTATTFAIDVLLDRPAALASAQRAAHTGDDDAVRAHMWEAMRLAPQGPGLLRRARTDFDVAAGTLHETRIPAGTVTFAATQSAMLDGGVVEDADDFRTGRPVHDYLHFGAGLHQCFGRFANVVQIPLIAKAILREPALARAPGAEGRLTKDGPFAKSLVLAVEPDRAGGTA